jgi:predicted O-methyltransferase YrrM
MTAPDLVELALRRSAAESFEFSCESPSGEMFGVLAAAVRSGGRVLELGTGVGVGLAWAVHGLRQRTDVTVVSVEIDPHIAGVAASADWPDWVELLVGDGENLLPTLGKFDLIFADAQGGKWTGLQQTLDALNEHGLLLLDDMNPDRYTKPEHLEAIAGVRTHLAAQQDLILVELAIGTHLIIATKLVAP